MHYFVTGHTGFKGSWLILLLRRLGHEVSGYSLEPIEGGLFQKANLEQEVKNHFIGDIRNLERLSAALEACKPDFAIHMAAQPLVLRSYEEPVETYTTNVDGTLNFLRAVTEQKSRPISLVITTDKVYRDDGKGSYCETDPLGGHDPYSASKAMADILTQSWAAINPDLSLHIARAGNVIGAFDASENRLIPDAIKSIRRGEILNVRHPESVRPWQHVLDCLAGYILLLKHVSFGGQIPVALNFGPDPGNIRRVSEVIEVASKTRPDLQYLISPSNELFKETRLLTLDSSLSARELSWRNQIDFQKAIRWSFEELSDGTAREVAESQISEFLNSGNLR
jgi:CDP-glucose 4,6-dehydratase